MFHLEKLKDLRSADKYTVIVSNRFEVLDAFDPVELLDTYKRETLEAAKGCIGRHLRSQVGFASA